jgi:hypothetical protein
MAPRFVAAPVLVVAAILNAAPAVAADKEAVRQAVERGVRHLKTFQAADGSWPTHRDGATALAALALLECDVDAVDPAVQRAAGYLRNAWTNVDERHATYCLSLMILFFDRLADPVDEPIIQALAVRLLGGQNSEGAWSYACPPLGTQDVRQLKSLIQRKTELKATGKLPEPAWRDPATRTRFPKEVQEMVARTKHKAPARTGRLDARVSGGDNSNTQFAILGLWVARRHGAPVDKALARAAAHFRGSQNADGGWGYPASNVPLIGGSTPSMTCAGLLGLALGFGSAREAALRSVAKLPTGQAAAAKALPEPAKDPAVRAGLAALDRVVGQPLEEVGRGIGTATLGDMYYLLWSVERVAVAYDLAAVGGKDWYDWGAAHLLPAQRADGGWHGKFGSDVDSSFALLFLRRANLSRDLTAYLKNSPVLKADIVKDVPVGRDEVAKPATPKGGIDAKANPGRPRTANAAPAVTTAEVEAKRLGEALLQASGPKQQQLLDQLKQEKGVAFTGALAAAIPRLNGDIKAKARDALAERLARMTPATLRQKFQEDSPEVRRAAALACALKEDRQFVPDLIHLLEDRDPLVGRAEVLPGQRFEGGAGGPAAVWKNWWEKQGEK